MLDPILESLRQFLLRYAQSLTYREGVESEPPLPDFELYAYDYLQFAETEIEQYQATDGTQSSNMHLMNCISYLKRAMDCALDTFLTAFNILPTFRKRNLGLKAKLDFLERAGVFSSRTLSRLNTVRNKMEHEYEVPKVQDIEAYFDLVSAFVSVLERTATFARHDEDSFDTFDDADGNRGVAIDLKYNRDVPNITVQWWDTSESYGPITYDLSTLQEFAFVFRVMILLLQSGRLISARYVAKSLEA